jgi:hypothetical protein
VAVERVDLADNRVVLADQRTLAYDRLVVNVVDMPINGSRTSSARLVRRCGVQWAAAAGSDRADRRRTPVEVATARSPSHL